MVKLFELEWLLAKLLRKLSASAITLSDTRFEYPPLRQAVRLSGDFLPSLPKKAAVMLVRSYVHGVVIACAAERSPVVIPGPTSGSDFVFDPLHYLALLERKIGA